MSNRSRIDSLSASNDKVEVGARNNWAQIKVAPHQTGINKEYFYNVGQKIGYFFCEGENPRRKIPYVVKVLFIDPGLVRRHFYLCPIARPDFNFIV